jgi:hypothetical protein
MDKTVSLIEIYKGMSEKQLQDEIDAIFDIVFAVLEATESDSIEQFPSPNVKLKISCEVIKDESKYYC